MYTVKKLCELFLDKIDQEGNEIISTAQIMELLETEATSYIEEVYKYVENNQQLRDSILPLTKAYYLNALQNPSNNEEMIVSLPSDYLHLETADVIIPDVKVREVTIRRRGEVLANKNNPNQKPTDQYPTVIEYADTLSI